MQAMKADQRQAAMIVFAGGMLALVAAFLSWLEFAPQGAFATTYKGTDMVAGTGTLGFAIVALIAGIFLWARGARTGGRGSSIVVIVCAAFIVVAGGYSAIAPADALVEFESSTIAEQYKIPDNVAKEAIKGALESGNVEVSALIGAWVALAGGLVALAGGILGVRKAREIRDASAGMPPTPPFAPEMDPPPPTP